MQFLKDEKQDFITVGDRFYTHKQIEIKNGIVYMRMKKRSIKNEQ